jgi:hypothetical protein
LEQLCDGECDAAGFTWPLHVRDRLPLDLLSCLPGAVKAVSDRRGAGGGSSKGSYPAASVAEDPVVVGEAGGGVVGGVGGAAAGGEATMQGGLQAEEDGDAGVQGAGLAMHQFRPEIQVRGRTVPGMLHSYL